MKSFAVSKYCESLQKLIRSQVPQVWVHGVIAQLQVREKMVYLTLAEFREGDPKPVAVISLYMYGFEWERIQRQLASLAKPFQLAADLKVLLKLEADFYIPQGKFQAHVIEIDPSHTLGELALTRAKILDALKREGLLDKNRLLPLVRAPLQVGLITAAESAAFNDFKSVLESSLFAFEVTVAYARMQGNETESTVLGALEKLQNSDLDVICIVRGGGAKTDLTYFDSEKLCRAIAAYPVPVLTGIGHEIDESLADLVAWQNRITPTACAEFLVKMVELELADLNKAAARIDKKWQESRRDAQNRLLNALRRVNTAWNTSLYRQQNRLNLTGEKTGWIWKRAGALQRQKLNQVQLTLKKISERKTQEEMRRLRTDVKGLQLGAGKIVSPHKIRLVPVPDRLKSVTEKKLTFALTEHKHKEKWLEAVNPKRVLQKGYSITRLNGRAIGPAGKGQTGVQPGDELVTQTAAGIIYSSVIRTETADSTDEFTSIQGFKK